MHGFFCSNDYKWPLLLERLISRLISWSYRRNEGQKTDGNATKDLYYIAPFPFLLDVMPAAEPHMQTHLIETKQPGKSDHVRHRAVKCMTCNFGH